MPVHIAVLYYIYSKFIRCAYYQWASRSLIT